jgi:hypothetical protein
MKKLAIVLIIVVLLIIGGYFGYKSVFAHKIVSENTENVLTCSDSDGYDIYIKGGTNFERDEPGESSIYNSPDTCEPHPKYGTVLREGVCEGNVYKEVRVKCGMGYECINGMCVKS